MSGGGERLCGEHGRSDDGSRPNRAAGGAASAEAAGLTEGHGEEFGEDQQRSGAAQKQAAHGRGDWREGGEGAGTLQNGQALRVQNRRGQFRLESSCGIDRAGREAGWDLCAENERTGRAAFGGRDGAQLQELGGSRTGFPLSERDRSVGAADSASQ